MAERAAVAFGKVPPLGAAVRGVFSRIDLLWATLDFPDTLNGNMCSGDRNGFKEALHGRIQA